MTSSCDNISLQSILTTTSTRDSNKIKYKNIGCAPVKWWVKSEYWTFYVILYDSLWSKTSKKFEFLNLIFAIFAWKGSLKFNIGTFLLVQVMVIYIYFDQAIKDIENVTKKYELIQ